LVKNSAVGGANTSSVKAPRETAKTRFPVVGKMFSWYMLEPHTEQKW
jgi:hypothetical protein